MEKFYWLKLKRDFFKRHDIKIIESMPNGKDYLLFYLKLLCESVDHEGNLRFSEEIPYDDNMLSIITNTNIDIVRSAIKLFTQLDMMEILDDGTYFMSSVDKMIGSAVNNDNANRQRRFREKQKTLALCERYVSVTKNNESKSKSKSKNKEENNNNIIIKEESFSQVQNALFEMPLNVKDTYFSITTEMVEHYKELYPNVNVEQQLRNMVGWLESNPTKRKTKTGIQRFINSWLSKEQDRPTRSKQISNAFTDEAINNINEGVKKL